MRKVAVIGSSHVAALKLAWDRLESRYPDVAMEFLAVKATDFHRLRLRDDLSFGIHRPASEAGQDLMKKFGHTSLKLAEAEAVLWAGVADPYADLADLLACCDIAGVRETGAPTLLEAETFDDLLRTAVRGHLPPPAWHNWRTPRLFACLAPAPSEDCGTAKREKYRIWSQVTAHPEGVLAQSRRFQEIFAEEFAGIGISFLPQPAETLGTFGLTLSSFKQGAARIRGSDYAERNFSHMNTEFGELVVRNFLEQALGEAPARTTATAVEP